MSGLVWMGQEWECLGVGEQEEVEEEEGMKE